MHTKGTKFTRYKGCTGKNKSSYCSCLPATYFFPLVMYLLLIFCMYLQNTCCQWIFEGGLQMFQKVC